ncbi:MAG TPA: SEC-C metal-binding domain-containing protein [Nocardioidaceae bacterium]|nr:SEC-C metal-binding domain-containing protein [Nocardioidaceae bacterium]
MHEDEEMLDHLLDEVEHLAVEHSDTDLAQLLEHRAQALDPGARERAAWLSHAGERWEMADDLVRARACYEEAVRDGGVAWIDPRASLVSVLLDLGDPAAEPLLDELRSDLGLGRLRGPVHEYVGEALELHDRLEEALRWFTSGLTQVARDDPEDVDLGCLNGRYRVRRQLGLPRDRFDELCEERRHTYEDELDREEEQVAPLGEPTQLVALHWPADQFERLVDRWPHMREEYGDDHAEHAGYVERTVRRLSEQGVRMLVGDGDVEEYVEFAAREGNEPAESATRAAYGAHLGYLHRARPWPPGRNDPCWCGSGTKYQECCGGLRFPAEEDP